MELNGDTFVMSLIILFRTAWLILFETRESAHTCRIVCWNIVQLCWDELTQNLLVWVRQLLLCGFHNTKVLFLQRNYSTHSTLCCPT